MPEIQQESEKSSPRSGLSRVNDELALGYDSEFERQWWNIEVGLWCFLSLLIIVGLTGLLGHGPLAHKTVGTMDGALVVKYQRVARYKTPDVMTIFVSPRLYQDGKAHLWLSRAIVEKAGLQRIIPEPEQSLPGEDGVTYIFPVSNPERPTLIELAKEPSSPGAFVEEVRTDSQHDMFMRTFIVP